MSEFIFNVILWTLALYGLIEIIRSVISVCVYANLKYDGIYLIVAVKNREDKIEGFLRSILYKFLYGKNENLRKIIVTDLKSEDNTLNIIKSLQNDDTSIQVMEWEECKKVLDSYCSKS